MKVKYLVHDVSSLVKKKDYNGKISDINKKVIDHDHDEYIATSEFNKLTTQNFATRLSQANLLTRTDFDMKLTNLN